MTDETKLSPTKRCLLGRLDRAGGTATLVQLQALMPGNRSRSTIRGIVNRAIESGAAIRLDGDTVTRTSRVGETQS